MWHHLICLHSLVVHAQHNTIATITHVNIAFRNGSNVDTTSHTHTHAHNLYKSITFCDIYTKLRIFAKEKKKKTKSNARKRSGDNKKSDIVDTSTHSFCANGRIVTKEAGFPTVWREGWKEPDGTHSSSRDGLSRVYLVGPLLLVFTLYELWMTTMLYMGQRVERGVGNLLTFWTKWVRGLITLWRGQLSRNGFRPRELLPLDSKGIKERFERGAWAFARFF